MREGQKRKIGEAGERRRDSSLCLPASGRLGMTVLSAIRISGLAGVDNGRNQATDQIRR